MKKNNSVINKCYTFRGSDNVDRYMKVLTIENKPSYIKDAWCTCFQMSCSPKNMISFQHFTYFKIKQIKAWKEITSYEFSEAWDKILIEAENLRNVINGNL